MSFTKQRKKWKKILTIVAGVFLSALAGVGIGLGSYYVAKNSVAANDLSEGRTIKLDFNLVDAHNNFLLDINKEEELLKESSNYLISTLETKGLTNISVSYGFQYKQVPSETIVPDLTSNVFGFGSGLDLNAIVDNQNNPINTSTLIDEIFKNKNIMFYNSSDITDKSDIIVRNLSADFNKKSLKFSLTIGNYIRDKEVTFYGFNNAAIPDLNPTVKLVTVNNVEKPVAIYRIGLLYASFENSLSSFSLRDVDEEENNIFNDFQVYKNLSFSNRYSLEPIKSRYDGVEFPSTGRTNSHLFVDSSTVDSSNPNIVPQPYDKDLNYYLINGSQNIDGKIERYVDKDGKTSDSLVNIKSYNTYNSGSFVIDSNAYNKLLEEESSTNSGSGDDSDSSQPKPSEQYQTTSSWILWNDKEGFLNYLNQLVISWYFNLYANIPLTANGVPTGNLRAEVTKDNWKEKLFNTDEWNYVSYVSPTVRNSINNYLSSLEDIEKQFMAYIAYVNDWLPQPITESNLIQTLYDFYFQSLDGKPSNSFNSNTSSASELSGWGWVESDAEDNVVKTLSNGYIEAFIDYRNYSNYFVNPNPPDTEAEDYKSTDPIDPFYVKNFTFGDDFYDSELFVGVLENSNYKFPLVSLFNSDSFTSGWKNFTTELVNVIDPKFETNKPKPGDFSNNDDYTEALNKYIKEYNEECTTFANGFLKTSLLFGQQNVSKPKIDNSITGLEPLIMAFIVISAIIFLVGIFVSVYYRIPGFIAFVLSSLTYVLSLFLYSNFSFVFSFFSLMSAAFSSCISFITAFFYLNNFKKEIFEDSSITGATIKSIKKYWKTSLDIHIVLLITALAFLFFGEINNVNFGAMLIISIFLSFILSGVIFYVIILLFVVTLEMNNEKFFMTEKQYKYLLKLEDKKPNKLLANDKLSKFIGFFVDVNYFSTKFNFILIGAFLLIAFVGIFIFAFIGPVYSLDFTSSNIIIFNNFENIGLSKDEIIRILGLSTINNYVYDDQLVIYLNNSINANSLLASALSANIDQTVKVKLIDSLTSSILSSEINIRLVLNTLKCIGIGIGFSSIWVLMSLNIVAVIPIIASQLGSLFIIVGLVGISRMPFDINGIAIFMFLYLISTSISIASLSAIKKSWNKKFKIDIFGFKSLINSILRKINKNFVFINLVVLLFAIISMILISPSLIFTFLILIVGSIVNLVLINRIVVISWFYASLIKNKFTKEIDHVKSKMSVSLNYDDVNEQHIKGLNC